MASALMVETFCLASASASRILLPTAESWCCAERAILSCTDDSCNKPVHAATQHAMGHAIGWTLLYVVTFRCVHSSTHTSISIKCGNHDMLEHQPKR